MQTLELTFNGFHKQYRWSVISCTTCNNSRLDNAAPPFAFWQPSGRAASTDPHRSQASL